MDDHLQFLYTCDKELCHGKLEWKEERNFMRIESDVIAQNGEHILFKGTYSPRSHDFSFILLYRRKYVIRRFDMEPRHWNPGKKVLITGEHKHFDDGTAYNVHDINTSDVNQAIFDFFEECNIDYKKIEYHTLMMI
ncbi:DUF6978 family protein [Sporolactobacillus vineae]|uniref:DUF6978 family protein n=1 Tax=Sporolactobacillus vineae TaxID=444463 RepID=UPI000288E037|nr:hypothetical protein [Sporolactobacillus vineae]